MEVDYGDGVAQVLLRKDEQVDASLKMEEVVSAPVKAGQQVGKMVYYLEGDIIKEYPIIVVNNVSQRTISWVFDKILQLYLGI